VWKDKNRTWLKYCSGQIHQCSHTQTFFYLQNVIISQLWKRYRKRQIYTYVGDILVSLNPFQKLDLYTDKVPYSVIGTL